MISSALMCLALNIYFEARSESFASQVAVAQVTLNRIESKKYPNDVCAVVKQPKQFSWYSDGKSEVRKEKEA